MTSLSDHLLCILFTVFTVIITVTVRCVKIYEISGPRAVKNATTDVILDCKFEYDEVLDKGLVVKWYFSNDSQHILQWIQSDKNYPPVCSEDYYICPFLDLNHTSDDQYNPYRSIKLIKPTTKLSGRYTCKLMSEHGGESASHLLTIYEPEKKFDFYAKSTTGEVICEVSGIFPKPILLLYRQMPGIDKQPVNVTKSSKRFVDNKSGHYTIRISYMNDDSMLSDTAGTRFECLLAIPHTNYTQHKSLVLQKVKFAGKSREVSIHRYGSIRGGMIHCFILILITVLFTDVYC